MLFRLTNLALRPITLVGSTEHNTTTSNLRHIKKKNRKCKKITNMWLLGLLHLSLSPWDQCRIGDFGICRRATREEVSPPARQTEALQASSASPAVPGHSCGLRKTRFPRSSSSQLVGIYLFCSGFGTLFLFICLLAWDGCNSQYTSVKSFGSGQLASSHVTPFQHKIPNLLQTLPFKLQPLPLYIPWEDQEVRATMVFLPGNFCVRPRILQQVRQQKKVLEMAGEA